MHPPCQAAGWTHIVLVDRITSAALSVVRDTRSDWQGSGHKRVAVRDGVVAKGRSGSQGVASPTIADIPAEHGHGPRPDLSKLAGARGIETFERRNQKLRGPPSAS
jgi:hypothetical protein